LFRLREGQIFGERYDAAEFRIELLQAFQINLSEALGSNLTRLYPAREAGDGSEGNFVFIFGERAWIGFAADELVAVGAGLASGKDGVPTGVRDDGRRQIQFVRAGAALVDGGEISAPA
jgi:hypothetical protein